MTDVVSDRERAFQQRWPVARPFVVIGAIAIIAGGLVAAVSRPTDFEIGPWLAAFLVLEAGVAQIALGAGQAWLAEPCPSSRQVGIELVAWNLGVVATMVGTLASTPLVTTIGGAATVVALVLFGGRVVGAGPGPRWARNTYVGLVAFVLVSTPVGMVLAWTRHS